MDQTIMQAIWLGDVYISQNSSVTENMVNLVYCVALEISIKINEDMLLAIADLVVLFENQYPISLFLQLEKHIMNINRLKLDPVTPLDFVLHFLFLDRVFWELDPYDIANNTLPVIHYALIDYESCRVKRSVIAVAAICYVLQDLE